VVVGIASIATSILHLLVRDRRRGELVALLFIIIIPFLGMLPAMLDPGSRRHRQPGQQRERVVPAWVENSARGVITVLPSETYVSATRSAASQAYTGAARRVGILAAMAVLLHAIGGAAFARVLDSPGSSGARRAAPMHSAWTRQIPGLTMGASAVAFAQLRLALRTPRGRSTLISPLIMFIVFGALMYRGSGTMDLGHLHFQGGLSLAAFASAMCLVSVLPIAMNQFAVDRAGLTMALLSPLKEAELLTGKAVGNALIVCAPCTLCVLASLLIFRGGSAALWMTIPLALIAVYLIVAPIAAAASAMFPRVVDLNSIGRGSNAHGASGLIGLVSFVTAGAPPALLVFLAISVLNRPALAPVFLAAWCAVAFGVARLLFIPARRIFISRRENLAMLR